MSTGFMLDTSICIDILRTRSAALINRLKTEREPLYLSTVVVMELAVGPNKLADPRRAELLEAFLARLDILPFDEDAARHTAAIRAVLERQGRPIGPYDYQIAGHARSRGLTVVTRNTGEFERVAGLTVEDWSDRAKGFHE
ncbi:type II toxin-antitoxin system VapC family toxin [Brevundimonas sp.]|uniref:type II toxin-antitoxin system VapC family toxin n=1 Tax=Brevundimonas sp. TaxID=1871086 RepID=UPI00356568AE